MFSTLNVRLLPPNENDMDASVARSLSGRRRSIILSVFGSLSQISFRSLPCGIVKNRLFIRAPHVLQSHAINRGYPAKRQHLSIIIIMQKQVNNRVSFDRANESIIRSIGNAFNAVKLVTFQTRRIRRRRPATTCLKKRETATSCCA